MQYIQSTKQIYLRPYLLVPVRYFATAIIIFKSIGHYKIEYSVQKHVRLSSLILVLQLHIYYILRIHKHAE